MRLWRHKQFCYDSGLRVPLVIHFQCSPDRLGDAGKVRDEIVSGLDISQLMRKLHADGKLNPVQDRFWADIRPSEELYESATDPHEINNPAFDPKYKKVLDDHRNILGQRTLPILNAVRVFLFKVL